MAVKLSLLISAALQGKDAFAEAEQGMKGVGAGADIAAFAMKALSAVAIAAFLMDSAKKAGEFEDSLNYLQVATNSTDEQMKELSAAAIDASNAFGDFGAVEIARSMTVMAKAGYGAAGAMEYINDMQKLAMVSQSGLEETTQNVSRVMKSYGMDIDQTSRIVDTFALISSTTNVSVSQLASSMSTLAPVAVEAGLSFEEMAAAIVVLSESGLGTSRAVMTLRQMIMNLQTPSANAQKYMRDLGIEIYNLTPAAESAERALKADYQELDKLQQQMDEVSASSKALQGQLDQLNLQESKNNLQIMKIRDAAADQNRELTKQELDAISQLDAANRDLSISQSSLSIQQDELRIKEKALQSQSDATAASIEENTTIYNTNKGDMKSLTEITDIFRTALAGLTEQEQMQALSAMVGERAAASMIVLMKEQTGSTDKSTKSLDGYTQALQDSSGAATAASATIGTGLGDAMKDSSTMFQNFQIQLATEFGPQLEELFRIFMEDIIPALLNLLPLVAALAEIFSDLMYVLEPLLELFAEYPGLIQAVVIAYVAWTVAQWALNVAMDANPIGVIILAVVLLTTAIVLLVLHWKEIVHAMQEDPKLMALGLFIIFGPLGLLIFAIIELKKHWDEFVGGTKQGCSDLEEAIKKFLAPIVEIVTDVIKRVTDIINTIKTEIEKFLKDPEKTAKEWYDYGTKLALALVEGFGKVVSEKLGISGLTAQLNMGSLELPSFDTGGIVPGAYGEPQLILAHGGEEVVPQGESSSKSNISVTSHDVINVTIHSNREITDAEVDRISTKLAKQISNKKIRSVRSALGG